MDEVGAATGIDLETGKVKKRNCRLWIYLLLLGGLLLSLGLLAYVVHARARVQGRAGRDCCWLQWLQRHAPPSMRGSVRREGEGQAVPLQVGWTAVAMHCRLWDSP